MDEFPSSPSNSSLSSSDLDTESTGSFFPDRSTTLGTLMGVAFYNRSTSARLNQEQRIRPRVTTAAVVRRWRWRRSGGGRRWRFNLCGDHMSGPTSLGEFLQVERSLYGGGLVENERGGSGRLFDNGMVLPPVLTAAAPPQVGRRRLIVRRLGRLPVLLTGICCGGHKV